MNTPRRGTCPASHPWAVLTFAAWLVLWPGLAATAPAQAPGASMRAATFAITGFEVRGDNPLDPQQTQRLLAPFVQTDATLERLRAATQALEAALHARGHGLYRVALGPQALGGVVVLELVQFRLGSLSVEGAQYHGMDNIRRGLPALREGRSPDFHALAVQTALDNASAVKQVQVVLRESSAPDQVDATVRVSDQRPWQLAASLSNYGSDATGQDRLTLYGSHGNLFDRDHELAAAWTTSLERPHDVRQLGLSYRAPLYTAGGELSASYTRSDVVGSFGAFSSTGAGQVLAVGYTQHLAPQDGFRQFLSLGLQDKVFEATRIDGVRVPGQMDRRSRPLVAGWSARQERPGASWRYSLELAVNTAGGAGNDLAAYQSEDARLATPHWRALRATASGVQDWGRWQGALRAQAQHSDQALIAGEQFGLGGPASVRGTRQERALTGDQGASLSLEVYTPPLAQGLRLLGFTDLGWVGNHPASGAARPASDIIASVGAGARWVGPTWALAVDYGRIVKGSRVAPTLSSLAPQRGEDRLYLSFTIHF